MPTGLICKGRSPVILISIFTVTPDQQENLVRRLNAAIRQTILRRPGFVSASIHKSLDGVRVVNYEQWRKKEDLEAMLRDKELAEHMRAICKIATLDAHLYGVSEVHALPIPDFIL